jgi:CPA2 family monovalent cation:H+ antiporter-2
MLRKHSIESKKDTFNLKDDLPGLEVTSFKIKEGCIFQERTLKDIDLRNKHGVTVLAIRRGNQTIENPKSDTQLMSGDILILIGKPDRLCNLRRLLEGDIKDTSSESCTL